MVESGKRVSNTWIIYLSVGDNPAKVGLIPHKSLFREEERQRILEQSRVRRKMSPGPISLLAG